MERHNGVMIGGTCGAVARAGRLTLLVGDADESLGLDSVVPGEALRIADELAAADDWAFETVAAALQAFVIDHDPPGVAALLESDEETMVFLFDQAEAIEFDDDEDPSASVRVQRGVGRSGWTTELVTGPWILLRLGLDPVVPWTELRWGVAIGSTAMMAIGLEIPPAASLGEPEPASVEMAATETAPHAATAPRSTLDEPTDEHPSTEDHTGFAVDPAVDGWDGAPDYDARPAEPAASAATEGEPPPPPPPAPAVAEPASDSVESDRPPPPSWGRRPRGSRRRAFRRRGRARLERPRRRARARRAVGAGGRRIRSRPSSER